MTITDRIAIITATIQDLEAQLAQLKALQQAVHRQKQKDAPR